MNEPTNPPGENTPEQDSPGEPFGKKSPADFAIPEPGESHLRHLVDSPVMREIGDEDEELLVMGEEHTLATPERQTEGVTGAPRHDRFEKWFILLLVLFGTLTVLASSFGVGMSWDEAYYVEASASTLEWASGVVHREAGLLDVRNINRVWDVWEHEPKGHPPMTRWLGALGLLMNGNTQDSRTLPAMRWPFAACFGLTLAFLYLLMRMTYGRVTAWISVVSYFFMPRVFGHAHFALTETPMNLFAVLCVYAFLRGLKDWKWSVLLGVFFGLALATKINAFFFIPILWLWAFVYHRRDAARNLYAMTFIAPSVLVAVWPWLWHDTFVNFTKFLAWNVQRFQTPVFFAGQMYGPDNVAPWSYAPTLMLLTVPVFILVLSAVGLARVVHSPRRHSQGALFLFAIIVQLGVMMLPSTPAYDGVRLFLPVFPFLAALAGIGGGVIVRSAAWFDRPDRRVRPGALSAGIIIIVIVGVGGWAVFSVNPYFLTYFNFLAGSREKAYRMHELTYWGEIVNRETTEIINDLVPPGATLSTRAMNLETVRYMQKWGWIKADIEIVENPLAEYLLVQHRRGMLSSRHPVDNAILSDVQPLGYVLVAVFPARAATDEKDLPLASLYRRTIQMHQTPREEN